jgi:hypothetical protein
MKFADLKASTQLTWGKQSKRRPGTEPKDKVPKRQPAQPKETPGLINGQPAGSSYEWNVARALWALGWNFSYQVPVMGGSQIQGGQVLDFLVHTVPVDTAVIVNGSFWHQGDEQLKDQQLMDALASYGYQVHSMPLVLWNAEASTYEAAYNYLNTKLGRN